MEFKVDELDGLCSCGQTHELVTKVIHNEQNALAKIRPFLKANQLDVNVVMICDSHTDGLLKTQACHSIHELSVHKIVLNANGLHADEAGLEAITKQLPETISVFMAFGAGTIHDLTRYISHERAVPFISVPTAASVDGFASTVAAMTLNGFKVTKKAVAPIAIFADPFVYAQAPLYLTASGVGDLLGKHTALLDWKVAHLLTGEPICQRVIQMTESAVALLTEVVVKLNAKDLEACERLMDGLLLSGLAMQMVKNSRPASGAEHHLSHLWEMHLINEETEALHGEKVGVGLLLICELYKQLLDEKTCPKVKNFVSFESLDNMKEIFHDHYEAVIVENQNDELRNLNSIKLEAEFDQIKALVQTLPTASELKMILKQVQGKTSLKDLGLNDEIKMKSLQLAPFVRARTTLLKIINRLER